MTQTTAPIMHPIPPDVPPRAEEVRKDGSTFVYYVLHGRFCALGIQGPEPTAEDFANLEDSDYPNGRDIFFVPVNYNGEIWQLDLPVICHDLAARTGITNESMAQHFVDIATRKTTAFLPMCSDLDARCQQIGIISEMVGFSRGFGDGLPSLDAVNEHRDAERARGRPGITDAMVRWYLDKGPRQCPWPDDPRSDGWFVGEDGDEAERDINMAIWERVHEASWAWYKPDGGPDSGPGGGLRLAA
jgi:hypothetical protein